MKSRQGGNIVEQQRPSPTLKAGDKVMVINDSKRVLVASEGNVTLTFKPHVPMLCSKAVFERLRYRNIDPDTRMPALREATAVEIQKFKTETQSKILATSQQPIDLTNVVDQNLVDAAIKMYVEVPQLAERLVSNCESSLTLTTVLNRCLEHGESHEGLVKTVVDRLEAIKAEHSAQAAKA